MAAPRLVIKKRMQFIQGKVRPTCHVQAFVEPKLQTILEEHFATEALFKRSAYSANWPATAIPVPAPLTSAMGNFLKNDACPEITVKTMLAGQMYQGTNAWEMLSFELAAKLSFDNFLALVQAAYELDRDVIYVGLGNDVDIATFEADADSDALAA
jgi:hypothetical protein